MSMTDERPTSQWCGQVSGTTRCDLPANHVGITDCAYPPEAYDHPACCGPTCQGGSCWECRGTGHLHAPLPVAATTVAEGAPQVAVADDDGCYCGADGGEGCWCCTEECPTDCMADHKGEQ